MHARISLLKSVAMVSFVADVLPFLLTSYIASQLSSHSFVAVSVFALYLGMCCNYGEGESEML